MSRSRLIFLCGAMNVALKIIGELFNSVITQLEEN